MSDQLHDHAFRVLEEYRKTHPEFVYHLRQRNTNQRLDNGLWFQGKENQYASVGLYNASAGNHSTKSVALVFIWKNGEPAWRIEILFKKEKNERRLEFYRELIEAFPFKKITEVSFHYPAPASHDEALLRTTLERLTEVAKNTINRLGLENLRIDPEKFEANLQRIEKHQQKQDENEEDELEGTNTGERPLNQIFYGPPGTGKTYTTIERAVRIASPDFNSTDRAEIREEYERLRRLGQIRFTTFHQSMSYEDFVEGIKPEVTAENRVVYRVQPGIFRQLVSDARRNQMLRGSDKEAEFEVAFQRLEEKLAASENSEVEVGMKRVSFFITEITDGQIKFRKSNGSNTHDLNVDTLRNIYTGETDYNRGGLGVYYYPLINVLHDIAPERETEQEESKNYVLIIDEINRGNVSQIFGELITMIERDKRLGAREELRVTLPYSKIEFGVPENLYLIGTMNTADRSVEALDAALRRRFHFEEMLPQPELLEDLFAEILVHAFAEMADYEREDSERLEVENELTWLTYDEELFQDKIEDLADGEHSVEQVVEWMENNDLVHLNFTHILDTINQRLRVLLDRDHTIGHSHFFRLKHSLQPYQELKSIFTDKIIPQLQEYFYGDYRKIAMVLGHGFCAPDEELNRVSFAIDQDEFESREIYRLQDVSNDEDFWDALQSLLGNE